MFNGDKNTRYFVEVHQITLFEILMSENNIKVINEIEHLTNTKSGVFHVRELDINRIDEICLKNDLRLYDDNSPSSEHFHWIHKLPKNLKLIVLFFLFIFVLYFIFGDLI